MPPKKKKTKAQELLEHTVEAERLARKLTTKNDDVDKRGKESEDLEREIMELQIKIQNIGRTSCTTTCYYCSATPCCTIALPPLAALLLCHPLLHCCSAFHLILAGFILLLCASLSPHPAVECPYCWPLLCL